MPYGLWHSCLRHSCHNFPYATRVRWHNPSFSHSRGRICRVVSFHTTLYLPHSRGSNFIIKIHVLLHKHFSTCKLDILNFAVSIKILFAILSPFMAPIDQFTELLLSCENTITTLVIVWYGRKHSCLRHSCFTFQHSCLRHSCGKFPYHTLTSVVIVY